MRKYYQAGLLLIAVVSLVSLLFYRHEYNKLRYVLEVFNYFGKPNQRSTETNCTTNTNDVPMFIGSRLGEPTSSWQRLENDLYVYSAYNIRDKEIQAVGFGSPNVVKNVQCAVLFENAEQPIVGNFSSTRIKNVKNADKDLDQKAYRFYCAYARNEIPVGVMFLTESNSNPFDYDAAPILPVKTRSQSSNHTNTAICVTPPLARPIRGSQMFSFVNFHDLIGVDNFIVYDFGISHELNRVFREMASSQTYWKFTYTTVPWNFPFPRIDFSIITDLIEADCLYRTWNTVMYVAVLSWDEYIVLGYHRTLAGLIKDYEKATTRAKRYNLRTLTFCTQQVDSPAVTNVSYAIFKKFNYYPNIRDNRPIYIFDPHEELSTKNIYTLYIGKDLATVNRYVHCPGDKFDARTEVEDKSIARFAEDIQNSQMFRTFVRENKLSPSDRR